MALIHGINHHRNTGGPVNAPTAATIPTLNRISRHFPNFLGIPIMAWQNCRVHDFTGGQMNARALLIGSATGGLRGVTNDLDTWQNTLAGRGFEIRRHEGPTASRSAVLAAYQDLIADTAADDCAVVFYSGHGARLESVDELPSGISDSALSCIVPTDFESSESGDFRGITALELSALQARLSDRTDNVTVILDCCYSGRMSRDPHLFARALNAVTYAAVAEHLRTLPEETLDQARRYPGGNPGTVRLVAAGPTETAMELRDGTRAFGVFTRYLAQVLTEAGDQPASWSNIIAEARRRVQVVSTGQRPEAEAARSDCRSAPNRRPKASFRCRWPESESRCGVVASPVCSLVTVSW